MAARERRLPLAASALIFAVLLVVSVATARPGVPWTTDEGAYALQARALADGHWSLRWEGATVDPGLAWYPIVNGSIGPGGQFPYVAHPAVPAVMRVAVFVAGETAGMAALPILGAVLAAVAAALIARELDRRATLVAFWLAGTGPLLVDGHLLWAHAPGAAAGGFAVLAGIRVARSGLRGVPGRKAAVLGVIAVVIASLLRSEGVLLGLALGAVVGAVLLRRRLVADALAAAGLFGGVALAVAVAEGWWRRAIVGSGPNVVGVRQTSGGFVAGRLSGGYHSLLWPSSGNHAADVLWLAGLGVAGLAAGLAAIPALRKDRPWAALLAVGAGIVTLAAAATMAANPGAPITGLLPAWGVLAPGLVAGWAWLRRTDERAKSAAVVVVGASALAVAAVVTTQYAEGGGLEWGGRFFTTVAAPASAAVAGVGVLALWRWAGEAGTRTGRALVVIACTALVTMPVFAGEANLRDRRGTVDAIVDEVVAAGPGVVLTTSDALPRNAWRTQPATVWLRVPAEDLGRALSAVDADPSLGIRTIELVVSAGVDGTGLARAVGRIARQQTAPRLAAMGVQIVVLDRTPIAPSSTPGGGNP